MFGIRKRKALDVHTAALDQLKAGLKRVNIKMDEMTQKLDALESRQSKMAVQMQQTSFQTRNNTGAYTYELELTELHGSDFNRKYSEYIRVFPVSPLGVAHT